MALEWLRLNGNARDADGSQGSIVGEIPANGWLRRVSTTNLLWRPSIRITRRGGRCGRRHLESLIIQMINPQMVKRITHTPVKVACRMGSLFTRLLFAIKYQEQRIVLSNLINSGSKILYDRNPRDRIAKVAPWLTLDGDPIPSCR
jgi:hypothetical protein